MTPNAEDAAPEVSVIVCTHEPEPGRFARVIESLASQTLPAERWELLIIDNASRRPLPEPALPHRVLREPVKGLVHARICGMRAARGDLLVFIDDDNLPACDYLQAALDEFAAHASVGAASGRISAEWEAPPPGWLIPLSGSMAIRDYGESPIVSPGRHHGPWDPVGAGMVVRAEVAREFVRRFESARSWAILGRQGASLGAGEDSLLAWIGYECGWQSAYLPRLRLTHVMPRRRMGIIYQMRLHHSLGRSHGNLCLATWMSRPPRGNARGLFRRWRGFRSRLGVRTAICRLLWEFGFYRVTKTLWSNPPIAMNSNRPPRITVVVPCFNSETTISRTLHSLQIQEYPDLEVIVVDGASKDGTLDIIAAFDPLVSQVISEPDRGQSDALNKGFARATGEVVGWLCADDELLPGALHEIARLSVVNPDAGIFVGVSRRIFADGTSGEYRPEPDAFEIMGFKNTIDQAATYWRRALHEKAGTIDDSLQFAMDWDWWNRLKRAGGVPSFTDLILANYHFTTNNKTSSAPEGNLRETYEILRRYGPLDGRLADIYMFLFRNYDLKGCCDNPPVAPQELMNEYWNTLRILTGIFGEQLIYAYNWNWMSKQMRLLTWH